MIARRLFSALVLTSTILILLGIDYWLGMPENYGRLGVALSLMAMVVTPFVAIEMNALWLHSGTNEVSDESRFHKHGSAPHNRIILGGTIVMIVISCLLPAMTITFRPDEAANLTTVHPSQTFHPLLFSFYGLIAAVMLTFVYEMLRFGEHIHAKGTITGRLSRAILIYIYLSMLFGMLIPHRWIEGDNALGLISIIALIATVKISDSCAFFAGKIFGSMKLAPHLSPKKTVEGAVGALLGGYFSVIVVLYSLLPSLFGVRIDKPLWWFVVYGALISIMGMVGDLAESLLKRDAQKKDSSTWLPGLGGLLDVLDSLVFAAPISYLLWIL